MLTGFVSRDFNLQTIFTSVEPIELLLFLKLMKITRVESFFLQKKMSFEMAERENSWKNNELENRLGVEVAR